MDPTIFAQLFVFGLLIGSVYGLVALGLTMIWGVMGVFNFAHGAMMVVGMYTVWFVSTRLGLPVLLGIPIAVLLLFVLGVAIHLSTIEPLMEESAGTHLIVTLGWMLILVASVQLTFTPAPRHLDTGWGAYEVAGVFLPRARLFGLAITITAVAAIVGLLYYTATGRAIRATADNRQSAAYAGLNLRRVDALTFGLGAGLAGLAGAVIVFVQRFDPYLGNFYLLVAFIVVVLGGLGSFKGALLGGIIIGMLQVYGQFYLPGTTYQILLLGVFIVILLLRPDGLFGVRTDG